MNTINTRGSEYKSILTVTISRLFHFFQYSRKIKKALGIKHRKLTEEQLAEFIALSDKSSNYRSLKCSSRLKESKSTKIFGICGERLCTQKYFKHQCPLYQGSRAKKETILRIIEYWMIKRSFNKIFYILEIYRFPIWRIFDRISQFLGERYNSIL